jgi:hypothetical protein
MNRHPARRKGFALAVAIFAIVVIGGIVAGAFFASNQDYRIGRNTLLQERALSIAEYGLNMAYSNWNTATNTQMANGTTSGAQFYSAVAQSGGSNTNDYAMVRITRLNDLTFWIVSEGIVGGTSANSGARRRTGAVLRLYVPSMNFLGALTVRGATKIGGSSHISGTDDDPAGWSCNTEEEDLAGVSTNNMGNLQTQGACSDASCIEGDPKMEENPLAAKDSTYFDYGGVTFDQLAASANKRLSNGGPWNGVGPSTSGSTCNTGVETNWGDVTRNGMILGTAAACESYFPVIYYPGDLKVNGGTGQGILLVGGNLEVTGGFEFYGPVVVKGTLKTTGTGGHFNGGVMAANVELDQNDILGNAVINYSSCAIAMATLGATLPSSAMQRGWSDMF